MLREGNTDRNSSTLRGCEREITIMTKVKVLLPAALLALVLGGTAFGQTTSATLSGVVRDPSGAVVPDVSISARNNQTGAARETTSDVEGRYSLTNLAPGHYDLRASRSGF